MTVDGIASLYYSQYMLADSSNNQQLNEDLISAEGDYGISNLTSALDSVGESGSTNLNISNINQFAHNTLLESQLSSYDQLKQMENNFSLTGNINEASLLTYLSDQYGFDAGSIDLDSITNLGSYANMQEEMSSLASRYSSYLSDYQSYVNDNTTGNLLDSETTPKS